MTSKGPSDNLPMTARVPPPRFGTRYPFVPYGLVPLVGLILLVLVALIPFAFGEVQAVAERTARQALERGGFPWVTVSTSGQWIILEGKPPSRAEAEAAKDVVRFADADTLFGPARPATWVIEHFTWEEDPLVLPDGTFAPAAVPPPATAAEAEACDKTMADLLSDARIQFDTGSASIGQSSFGVLDVIAAAATYCHGVLRIEGHTDNVGKDAANTTLSRERAEAVRTALIARNVPADRLIADGLGATKPLATNNNANGRARNRRIEIRTVRSPPT
jgi:outer membrane protein OmpA-like peptidoglycan-associated protein